MKKDELFRFVDGAIASTRFLAEDEFRSLPDPELCYKGGGPELNTFDPELDNVDARFKIDLASQALNEAYKKDERIVSVSSYYNDNVSGGVLVTSNGFRGDAHNTGTGMYVAVSLMTESGRPYDYWSENALFLDKLKTTGIGKKALAKAIKKIDPRKVVSGKYAVIVDNRVAGNLGNPFYQALQGWNLYQKQSFLINKENKPVASQWLTVTDDPLIPSGFGSRLFDYEGLMAVKRPVIEKGVLKNYYIDNYYGRKLGMKPTSGTSSNIVVNTGPRSPGQMLESLDNGIFITGFIGGNCNGSTGDFSYGIEGFLIRDGKVVHPVNEMNMTGNMNDFWFRLIETGNDPQPGSQWMFPSLMFEKVDLSGI